MQVYLLIYFVFPLKHLSPLICFFCLVAVFSCLPFPCKHEGLYPHLHFCPLIQSSDSSRLCSTRPAKPSTLHSPQLANLYRPWSFLVLLNLQWQLPQLVTVSWKLSPSLISMKFHSAFFFSFLFRIHLQVPGIVLRIKGWWSSWICPCRFSFSSLWAITSLSMILSQVYIFLMSSKSTDLDVSLAPQTPHDWSRTHTAFRRVLWASLKIAYIILFTFFT